MTSLAAFTPQDRNWIVDTENMWPTAREYLPSGSLKKVHQALNWHHRKWMAPCSDECKVTSMIVRPSAKSNKHRDSGSYLPLKDVCECGNMCQSTLLCIPQEYCSVATFSPFWKPPHSPCLVSFSPALTPSGNIRCAKRALPVKPPVTIFTALQKHVTLKK